MPLFDFYAAHPEESEINDDAMRAFSAAHVDALLKAIDFPEDGVVVDVGGGTGALLAAILAAHPRLYGILYDRPDVVRRARRVLSESRVADRCAVVGGSFFDCVPRHGSVYILKQIVHDWDDERAGAILRCCRQGMPPGARLLIVERRLQASENLGHVLPSFRVRGIALLADRLSDAQPALWPCVGVGLRTLWMGILTSPADD